MILTYILAGAIVAFVGYRIHIETQRVGQAAASEAAAETLQRDKDSLLDYLLRFYQLNLHDPYVAKPGYDEKRCYHCHYVIGKGHDVLCPWVQCAPLVRRLFTDNPIVPK
jgi:hypothetical protein